MIEALLTLLLSLAPTAAYAAPDVRTEPSGWCEGEVERICEYAALSIEAHGRVWNEPHPGTLERCGSGVGCPTRLGAMMWLLWCESRFDPAAYAEGYVGGSFNRARGIAQIGDAWWPVSDAEAFDWRWSVRWLAAEDARTTRAVYPECGVGE